MANVGKNIRNIRTQNKMTQDELAEKLFVSRQTVSNYETGKSNPDIDMLVKIAEVLNTDVNILIFGIPTPPGKKWEYLKLIIGLFITILLGIFMTVAGPWLKKYTMDTFNTALEIAYRLSAYPLFLCCAGWCIMQASGTFLGAKPLAGRISRVIHYLIILILILYWMFVIPFCIMEISYAIELDAFIKANANTEYSLTRECQTFIWNLAITLYYFRFKHPLIYSIFFFVFGAALWGTKPLKPADKAALPPNPDTPQ